MKMLILDTCTNRPFLVLAEQGKIVQSHVLADGKKLSTALFPLLQEYLEKQGWKIQDLSAIAVGTGPGSYMGMRTGATIAKTLAFASKVSLLEFATPLAFLPKNSTGSFACYGDAKMGEFFLVTGKIEEENLTLLNTVKLIPKEALEAEIANKDFSFEMTTPHHQWLAGYLLQKHQQGKNIPPFALELSYPR